MELDASKDEKVGYTYLIEKYHLRVIPHWHQSFLSLVGKRWSKLKNGFTTDVYPLSYFPHEFDSTSAHLEFALKYDGVNLGILWAIFQVISKDELVADIQLKPHGKYIRRIWFLYEFLSGKVLPIDDLTQGNYIELLEHQEYYTVLKGKKSQRQRIINNLLGDPSFCPTVRKTKKLKEMETLNLTERCQNVLVSYPKDLLNRALDYLYNKETKSSFEIEHIQPNASRTEKFIRLLGLAEEKDFCEKNALIELQNQIVDERFKNTNYRHIQNYIGQTLPQREIVHYVCPSPKIISHLMEGLINSHLKMKKNFSSPAIHAAVIAYGFVFLHPFEDGNGRIHRFLIHNILSSSHLVPKGLMFPVSAAILKDPVAYDHSLESFSRPLMALVEYTLNENGLMSVEQHADPWYRYIDMTAQAEALYDFILRTIDVELVEELQFLQSYDQAKQALQNVVDMPDRLIDLFIKFCIQNNGRLSASKKKSYFDFLTTKEVETMEKCIGALKP